MVDRKRPDISIECDGKPLLLAELKGPYATSTKRTLELSSGLERARKVLKRMVEEYSWQGVTLQLLTAIAPDGVVFYIHRVEIRPGLYLFIELGKIPIASSIENIGKVPRCISGFKHLKSMLREREAIVAPLKRRHIFEGKAPAHVTPDTKRLRQDLRAVYPEATSPTPQRRRSGQVGCTEDLFKTLFNNRGPLYNHPSDRTTICKSPAGDVSATCPEVLSFIIGKGFEIASAHQRDLSGYGGITVYTLVSRNPVMNHISLPESRLRYTE
ncbi:hypothetical protein HDU86_002381 [Geranomyces michiganensis]|nr:hypothetical protein HDU86_002381 [Geranomyces michiganensis]